MEALDKLSRNIEEEADKPVLTLVPAGTSLSALPNYIDFCCSQGKSQGGSTSTRRSGPGGASSRLDAVQEDHSRPGNMDTMLCTVRGDSRTPTTRQDTRTDGVPRDHCQGELEVQMAQLDCVRPEFPPGSSQQHRPVLPGHGWTQASMPNVLLAVSADNWCTHCQGLDHTSSRCPFNPQKRTWSAAFQAPSSSKAVCTRYNKYAGDCRYGKYCTAAVLVGNKAIGRASAREKLDTGLGKSDNKTKHEKVLSFHE